MAALDRLLAGVRADAEGRLVLLGGEAGVGKTALLRRFCARQERHARVLWGASEPLRTPRPLGPFVDIAETTGGELEQLVAQAARPHEVAAALLRELRAGAPAVLVLEDVHWADEATLDVITLLAARIGTAPALVVASYRDDELDRPEQLRFVLGELVRRPGRLRLDPLSRAAVDRLAEPHGVDGETLYQRTGGNPFFVVEALATGGEQIPETVSDAVHARAARLSPPARRLLEALAIVPGQVELWLLDALAGEFSGALDEGLASGILTAGRTQVAFRHELARLAIDDAMSPRRRLALHRVALDELAAREGDFARLSHHAEAAQDARAVLQWAPRAAERAAASGAHREAAAQYARALRFARAPELRAGFLQQRAHECYVTADFGAAIGAQEEALDCFRRLGDRRGEGDALRALSRLLFFAGRTDEGEPVALAAVELLEAFPDSRELAMAYGNVSQRRMAVEDTAQAVAWGRRALELAERLGDIEVQVYALTNIGAALGRSGDRAGRLRLERALDLARAHALEESAGRIFNALAMWPLRARRLEQAGAYLDAGLAYAVEHGLDTWRLYLLASRARLELARGSWTEAAETAAAVLRDPRTASLARGWALTVLGLVRARRGDPDADGLLEEAMRLGEPTAELERIGPAAAARAEAAWLAGADAEVGPATDAALALALRRGAPWVAGELAYWRRQAGIGDAPAPDAVAEPYRLALLGDAAGAAGPSAARTRRRSRRPTAAIRRRSRRSRGSGRAPPPRSSRAGSASAACAGSRAARGPIRARIRRTSPRASSRCSRCSRTACATRRSRSAWSCPSVRSTTTCPRSSASSTPARAVRRAPRPRGSASSSVSLTGRARPR